MSKAPGARPQCKHGVGYGGFHDCPKCHKEDTKRYEQLKPLADEFWSRRGEIRIEQLLYRAYILGMEEKP